MASAPYLIFSLHDLLYAVAALSVREIIWLPELTPIAEVPVSIVGVVNLRGKVVPVIDLNVRLGGEKRPYRVQDSVIVLEHEETLIGIIVSEVCRVRSIAEEDIEAAPFLVSPIPATLVSPRAATSPERREEPAARFVAGIAKVENDLIMLLHLENLLHLPGDVAASQARREKPVNLAISAERFFCPQATPEEKAIFEARARSLKPLLASQDSAGSIPLAVVGLNGEYFGIDLAMVREFSALRTVTPVPCCPNHVLGQMNLRGDILTLIDIRAALQMPLASARNDTSDATRSKVVVIQTEALRVGVLVDDVFDVLHLQPEKIRAVPAAVQSSSEEYLQGTAPYGERMLGILDLPKILIQGSLIVNEEV